VQQNFRRLALIDGVDEHIGLGGIAIFEVVGRELVIPFDLARFRVEREDAIGVEVVAGTVAIIAVGPGVAGGPVERIARGIV